MFLILGYIYIKIYNNMENNLGKLNTIFLQNAHNLFKIDNGRLLKEYVSMIKNDKNLLKEFLVYEYVENTIVGENLKECISESINYLNDVNKKTLKVLNDKVANFMIENKIEQLEEIKNEKLYEDIHALIFSPKSLKTINERIEKLNSIVEQIKEIKGNSNEIKNNFEITENSDAFYKFTIDKFNKKYADKLNENELRIFKTITSPKNDMEMATLFEQEKKECLALTNEFLNEDIDQSTREKLLNVKEKLLEQKFNKETYTEDILSFVDLKQTLTE